MRLALMILDELDSRRYRFQLEAEIGELRVHLTEGIIDDVPDFILHVVFVSVAAFVLAALVATSEGAC